MTLSRSPDRNTFQKEKYLERCESEDKLPSEDYLRMFDSINQKRTEVEASEEFKLNNLEYDLRTTDWILAKVRNSDVYAQNLYAAMCNNEFQKSDVFPILADQRCSYSWRYAGGIIADMQEKGDYIDWYCSGIRNSNDLDDESYNQLTKEQQELYIKTKSYVSESVVTDEIREDLKRLGWVVLENNDDIV